MIAVPFKMPEFFHWERPKGLREYTEPCPACGRPLPEIAPGSPRGT